MENLKKLASRILEKPEIKHEKLKPRKGEINALRKYLPTVGYKLITHYHVTGATTLPNSMFFRRKISNLGVNPNKMKRIPKAIENPLDRQYQIIKI